MKLNITVFGAITISALSLSCTAAPSPNNDKILISNRFYKINVREDSNLKLDIGPEVKADPSVTIPNSTSADSNPKPTTTSQPASSSREVNPSPTASTSSAVPDLQQPNESVSELSGNGLGPGASLDSNSSAGASLETGGAGDVNQNQGLPQALGADGGSIPAQPPSQPNLQSNLGDLQSLDIPKEDDSQGGGLLWGNNPQGANAPAGEAPAGAGGLGGNNPLGANAPAGEAPAGAGGLGGKKPISANAPAGKAPAGAGVLGGNNPLGANLPNLSGANANPALAQGGSQSVVQLIQQLLSNLKNKKGVKVPTAFK
ncbi:hypothetical protein BB560_003720 [Smittium megazygosporum]|uniref:Uncharacterized protein n=1 Tax=Smittium megazygosporum TaxID=133381 RepID=A0A2T9ZB91_9FUNG|nr:hypothetical protein BB560_003720 [Smittium megazygosporum]